MKSLGSITASAAMALALVPASTALAQRQQATPEQRIERLERQIDQVQRQVFPRGRPADTAGFSTEPAATQSSVATLDQRLDALERQMSDLLRQSEENGHRLQTLEADLAKARSDQDQRIGALEQRLSEAATAAPLVQPTVTEPTPPKPTSKPGTTSKPTAKPGAKAEPTPAAASTAAAATPATDAGEDAYTEGFRMWEAGNFDGAITSLRAFVSAYPRHRRVSYANNLIGRSLMSKGQAREAAAVFLANYRGNPAGERAADSLYYLGQAAMQLGQPGQACKVYQEFDAIYGAKARPDLRKQVVDAKAEAQCS